MEMRQMEDKVMRKLVCGCVALGVFLCVNALVEAGGLVSASITGDATISDTPDGGQTSLDFIFGGTDYGLVNGTAFLKGVTGGSGSVATFTFGAPDGNGNYDIGSNLRLVLEVTNNTPNNIYSATYTLGNGANAAYGIYAGSYSGSPSYTVTNPASATYGAGPIWTDNNTLAPGASIAYTVIVDLSNVAGYGSQGGGSFTITETDVVPEPSTLSLAVLGGLASLSLALKRRKVTA
jgi:hypothetical protein